MHFTRLRSWLLVSCAAAVLTAGCGNGHSLSPTAPTALPESSVSSIDGDEGVSTAASTAGEFAALGNGKGNGGGSSNGGGGKGSDKDKGTHESDKGKSGKGKDGTSEVEDADDDADDEEDDDDDGDRNGRRRSVVGFVTAVGGGSITIRGIVVKITETTVIRHGHRHLTITDIHVGDHAQAKGTMSADGKTFTATEVKVEDTRNDNDDDDDEDDDDADKVELKGAVAGLTGTCPAMTFTVGTTTVKTNTDTKFDDVTCAALANGNTVEVEGKKQADNSVLASTVELESGPNEVEGQISGLTGTCPSLTFTVGTTTVTTSASTTFSGVACSALANGTKVEVEGTLTGTTLAAVWVELD